MKINGVERRVIRSSQTTSLATVGGPRGTRMLSGRRRVRHCEISEALLREIALDILDARYGQGEITREELAVMRSEVTKP